MTRLELEQCISKYGKDIYSFCRYLTRNQQEAEDLYQDTFLRMIQLKENVQMDSNPKSYLLSVAMSIWKNRRRKAAWRERIAHIVAFDEKQGEEALIIADETPESHWIELEEQAYIRKQVYQLPDKLKVCVLLFYMEEQTVSEIAHSLRIPEGTVKSRLYQARKRLEKDLEEVFDEKRNR